MPTYKQIFTTKMNALADSINSKAGTSGDMSIDEMKEAVDGIQTGGDLPELTNPASASDILDGKEAIDGNGDKITGTLVPPVDTGENGLYKSMIEENVTEIVSTQITKLRPYAQYGNTNLVKIDIPNLTSVWASAFQRCSKLTGIIDFRSAAIKDFYPFQLSLQRTVIWMGNLYSYLFRDSGMAHLYTPNATASGGQVIWVTNFLKTFQVDKLTNMDNIFFNIAPNLDTVIIRTPTLCTNSSSIINAAKFTSGVGKFYVPTNLLASYSSATNWITWYNSGQIIGIDEDTTCAVGDTFTPTTTATGIDHWDKVDLQSYSVGTIDTTTGAVTTTTDGRLLIRGLDASDNILHVTYLQIGTGFNEAANLA